MSSSKQNDLLETEPSIDSLILEERIAARRLRITRRLEALKREAVGADQRNTASTEHEKEPSKSRKQIENSYQRLTKLIADGLGLVSNVEVACDAREAASRKEQEKSRRERNEKLEEEIKAAGERFDEITKKWEVALKNDVPQKLHKMLTSQTELCDRMVADKNKLIDELQNDLKEKDDNYVKDLRKQSADIDLILERMDEQMKTLQEAYREELDNVERAFYTERADLLKEQKSKWEQKTNLRKEREVGFMEDRLKRVDEYNAQLQALRVQDAEEYNMIKIKLETDVQILEQNLQQMKATYQLNQEKLEYNFQVLKKRDEENTITKSQQKRKITRLQDMLNNMKQKLRKQEQQYRDDNQSASDDLKRMAEQFKELQKKFRHFKSTDSKKFTDIWKMNEEQLKDLVTDVLNEDRLIHEQQLGLEWEEPDLEFMKNVGPIHVLKETSKTAMETVQEVLSSQSTHEDTMSIGTDEDFKLSTQSLKAMLELLCDESGFLVESKLVKLLAPIEENEQSLIKLDAMFSALGIETEVDILLLSRYLFKQPITMETAKTSSDDNNNADKVVPHDSKNTAPELIHPNDVIRALRKFVEDNKEPLRTSRKHSSLLGSSSERDNSKDENYWLQLSVVVDEKKERIWDAMTDGFEKYGHVLKERARLIQETETLRQQNAELRILLHQYLSSKVNQELQIPPTAVLQLNAPAT